MTSISYVRRFIVFKAPGPSALNLIKIVLCIKVWKVISNPAQKNKKIVQEEDDL
jgi:hypothetical protein